MKKDSWLYRFLMALSVANLFALPQWMHLQRYHDPLFGTFIYEPLRSVWILLTAIVVLALFLMLVLRRREWRPVLYTLPAFPIFFFSAVVYRYPDTPLHAGTLPANAPARAKRVVVVIFDGLDKHFFDAVHGTQFPNFDRLRKESLSFTAAFPPGTTTSSSIPAFLTEKPLRIMCPTKNGWAGYDRNGSFSLEPQKKALRQFNKDFPTAYAGWLAHACPVLSEDLAACEFLSTRTTYQLPFREAVPKVLASFFTPQLFRVNEKVGNEYPPYREPSHRWRVQKMLNLLAENRFALLWLHLDVPHLPGIVSGKSDAKAYEENLAETDRVLGIIDDKIKQMGIDTTLIVTSDHGLRALHDHGANALSVPLYIRTGVGKELTFPINSIFLPSLAEAILRGRINSVEQWITENQSRYQMRPVEGSWGCPPGVANTARIATR